MVLSDLFTGDLSWRRLGVLITHLPTESATKTALRNAAPVNDLQETSVTADYGPWSQTDMLLAELIDLARWQQWAKTKAADNPRTAPKPYPRPGVDRPMALGDTTASADVINLLEYVRNNNGASPEGYVQT